MFLRTIQYTDMEKFIHQISDKKFTHLEIFIGYKRPIDDAYDIEKILDYLKKNDYTNVEIHPLINTRDDPTPVVLAFAKMLSQGIYPKKLIINFKHVAFDNHECVSFLAQALETGHCYYPFTLQVNSVNLTVLNAFAKSLVSGKCHPGLHLDICKTLNLKGMLTLTKALSHKNCPEDLSLSIQCSLYDGSAHAIVLVSEAIKRGAIPKRFTIKIFGYDSEYITYLSPVLTSNTLPVNLTIKLVDLESERAPLLENLEKAFQANTLPLGLNINFIYKHRYEYKLPPVSLIIKQQIDEILKKNAIKHTALNCAILWQGNKQENSILSSLPEELIKDIQKYTFFNSVLPFFKTIHHEEYKQLEKNEIIFYKNVMNKIKK
jgi:hypothetical protein